MCRSWVLKINKAWVDTPGFNLLDTCHIMHPQILEIYCPNPHNCGEIPTTSQWSLIKPTVLLIKPTESCWHKTHMFLELNDFSLPNHFCEVHFRHLQPGFPTVTTKAKAPYRRAGWSLIGDFQWLGCASWDLAAGVQSHIGTGQPIINLWFGARSIKVSSQQKTSPVVHF